MPTPLLDLIHSPTDLRAMAVTDLPALAAELREFLIASVSATGGHLASNLGTVELTLALHYVYDTPNDRIVWDVGHQTYTHKILSGRRAEMAGLRQAGGIAGFPRRSESAFDAFGTGHSSTSISAALGMAAAFRQNGSRQRAVAVIGDGAMTAGIAFEALNNAGASDLPLLVVLNDNDMSISPNVGALKNYLAKLMSGRFYTAARRAGEKMLSVVPPIKELAKRAEEHMKGMVLPGTLFEEFGFNYIGPVDGHDLNALLQTLTNIKQLPGPQFLHIVTKKGKGYELAEANPCLYHGVSRFDSVAGIAESSAAKPTYTQIFSDWLCDMAAHDARLVAITPAMREGSGLVRFSQEFPQRYFDVGIAEQHALTFAAGLACEKVKPVVAIYSTFLQRAYDQLIHDIALQNLPVMLAVDRAGLVGADGPTHAGSFDLSYLRCIPNMVIAAPSDENECRQLLTTAFLHEGPSAVRYPRGAGPGARLAAGLEPFAIGKGILRRQGKTVALIAFGSVVTPALKVGDALDASVADMRFVKPLDMDLLKQLAQSHQILVTLEENAIAGGAGAACAEALIELGRRTPIFHLGLPDRFIEHGDPVRMLADCGLDAIGIETRIRQLLSK
jgi:1-deoxy-D-xylulose-5-phosphate synthase